MGRPPDALRGVFGAAKMPILTIKSYISAIKAVLKMHKVNITEDQYLLSSIVRACRLRNDKLHTCLPIQKPMLELILWQTKIHFTSASQPYLDILYRTMLSTMYFGLLRISEVTAGNHAVLARDVHIASNKRKILFLLRSSKTHGPQMIKISSCGARSEHYKWDFWPFSLLQTYIHVRGGYHHDDDEFFIFADGSPVPPRQFSKVLKTILQQAGFEHRHYSSHSLRSG